MRPSRSLFALLFSTSLLPLTAVAFPAASNLYVQPGAQPFIENTGETVVTVNVSSGSLSDAQTQLDSARSANPSAIILLNLTGTYTVSTTPLTLPSHTCLVLGAHAVIQASSSSATSPALIQVSSQTNVSIAGGTLIGAGANLNGIRVLTSNRVDIDKVVIQNCGAAGISLTGNGNTTFDNECTISRCEVSGSSSHGISISSGTQTVLVDNYCHNNGAAGIFVGTARSTIANNRCSSNATGIIGSGNDNAITDNTVDSNPTGIALDASSNNNICSSNAINNSSSVGLSDAGTNDTLFQNVFTGNASNLSATGTSANVIAWRGALSAANQRYFYPPLIDDQHALTTIMNGKGRTDLTIGATSIDSVQSQYNSAVSANPNNVIVLHLTGSSYAVGATPLTLSSNTVVLLNGVIQISSSTTASSAISVTNQSFICLSGGAVDGGNLTGNNGIVVNGGSMFWIDKMAVRNFGPSNPRVGSSDVIHFSGGSTPYIVSRSLISGGAARGIWSQLSSQKAIYTDNECTGVNMDGIDCDSNTFSSLCKFNNCHDNVRYGIFFEQGAPYNIAIANTCTGNGRGINVYNNALPDTRVTKYNTVACNLCDVNSNAIRSGSTGVGTDGTTTLTSHNFFFDNRATNSTSVGLEGDATGTENYYSGNIATGNGTDIRTSGSETFFNPTTPPLVTADPTFSLGTGTYIGTQTVSISTTTTGASINYTTDGSTPTSTTGTLYSGPISIAANTTLKAIAFATGYSDSLVTSATYTIQCAAPTFSPAPGTYSGPQTIAMTTATSGASIRYTTDGSTPTSTTGTLYTGAVTISSTTTLKAIAFKSGLADSTVTTGVYTINVPTTATPTFSPTAGTYTTSVTVTISSTTSGASIRYTTDGSTPTSTTGTLYSGPVTISATTTLKAIAFASGFSDSAVATAVYTIQCAAPTFTPAPGTYTSAQSVTIASATPGASIRYTTDGSTPTSTTGTLYSGPVTISVTSTLKAIAFKIGLSDSGVTSGTYTINTGGTTISVATGFFNQALPAAQTGSFTATFDASASLSPSNALIGLSQGNATAYTGIAVAVRFNPTGFIDARNGGAFAAATSIPFTANSTYHFRVVVDVVAHTYSAFVTPPGGSELTIGSGYAFRTEQAGVTQLDTWNGDVNVTPGGTMTVSNVLTTTATPTFSPGGGSYTAAQSVTITSKTVGASIRYTTDGSTPTSTTGTLYSGPVTISATTTLKAIAFHASMADSAVTSATYTISAATLTGVDIGTPPLAGSTSFSAGTYTVKGCGADIWSTSDQFQYANQSQTGDFTVTARVATQTNTNAWAKCGVMIRETTAANASYVGLYVTPANGISMQYRNGTGTAAVDLARFAGPVAPYWVRLVRSGSTITGYRSADGVTWTQVGTISVTMASSVKAGLAVCSHNTASLNTTTFDSVTIQ
jgi:parallel beta-helix repeat protein